MKTRKALALVTLAALALAVGGVAVARTGDGTNYSVTPNMQIPVFTPGVCGALGVEPPGKSWGELLGTALTKVDQHTHSPGYGLPVPANGLYINGDVPWNSNNLTQLRAARFTPLALGSLTALDVGTIFVSGADLYYVDTAGNQVRLTASGGIAGTPGSISGLASPAAVTYAPVSHLFTFTSSSGYAANMSQGPTSVCDATVSGGKCATVQVPAALVSNYAFTLPTALPGSTLPMTLSSTGQIAAAQLTASHLSPSAGILGSQLSSSAGILGSQLSALAGIAGSQLSASAGIMGSQLSASAGILGSQLSASAGIVGTQLSATAGIALGQLAAANAVTGPGTVSYSNTTTTHTVIDGATLTRQNPSRAVVLGLQPALGGAGGCWVDTTTAAGTAYIELYDATTSTTLRTWKYATGVSVPIPFPSLLSAGLGLPIGAQTYQFRGYTDGGGIALRCDNSLITLLEL